MGREARLRVDDGATAAEARVHLDSELLTIGPPFRLKLGLGDITACTASAAGLQVRAGTTTLTLAMSEKEAGAWAKGIANPPTLATKLGLKPGLTVATLGALPVEIDAALTAFKPKRVKLGQIDALLTFAAVPDGVPVAKLAALAKALPAKAAVWLVYEKGGAVNGDTLIYAARDAGLKDTKVAKISATHTGLRFIPA